MALLFTVVTIIATSVRRAYVNPGTYHVTSDCPGSTESGTLIVANNGTALGAENFGFPSDKLEKTDERSTIAVWGKNRGCHAFEVENAQENVIVFSCFENDELICTITMQNPLYSN